jgi:hypothetical protein
MVIRDILNKHSLPINFCVVHTGVTHDWLTPQEATIIIENHLLHTLTQQEIFDLYSIESRQDVITFLNQKLVSLKIYDCSDTVKVWWKAYLQEIIFSNSNIDEKLNLIANYWPYFNYPDEWKAFINYMPQKQVFGNNDLYQVVLEFTEKL